MIERFDHAVIGVRNLEQSASRYWEQLGLAVSPGGRHTGLGTENAIVRFGLDYLELLTVYDREEVLAAGTKRVAILDYLAERGGGLLGYCLATDDIDQLSRHFQQVGLDAVGPYDMERKRPDGSILRWRLLVPGGTAWRKPWPFFIQWGLPDDERLHIERPGVHPLGAKCVVGVTVAVSDLGAATYLYGHQLGLECIETGPIPEWNAISAQAFVGGLRMRLVAPSGPGVVQGYLNAEGEGLYEIALAVDDLPHAAGIVEGTTSVGGAHGRGRQIIVEPVIGCQERLIVVGDDTGENKL